MHTRPLSVLLTAAALVSALATGALRAQEGPPLVDGTLTPFEWRDGWRLFETGARPPGSTGWARLGLRAWIGHDQRFLYLGLGEYPAGSGVNGPFGDLYFEIHGTNPPRFLAQLHDDLSGSWPGIGTPWPAGTVMLRGGTIAPGARGSFEAKVPWAALGLDPWTESYEIQLRVDAPGGGGYDTLLSAGAGYLLPPTTAVSGRTLVATSPARFVGRTKPRLFPASPISATSGRGIRALHTADLDGDGRSELLAGFAATGELDVLRAIGGDNFQLLGRHSGLGRLVDLTSGDVDGDGNLDVLAIEEGVAAHIFYGDGLGALSPPQSLPLPGAARGLVFAYDADADGDLALLTRNGPLQDGALWVLRNDGGGSFVPLLWSDEFGTPEALASGDLDGDGRADLVVADLGSALRPQGLSWIRNVPAPIRSSLSGVAFPSDVLVGDLDGDGRNDLLAVGSAGVLGAAGVFFAPGLVGGGLGPFVALPTGAVLPWSVELSDLGGDRVRDLWVFQLADRPLLSLTDFQGSSFSGIRSFAASPASAALAVGDLQGDGFEDVVVLDVSADAAQVRYAGEAPRLEVFGAACNGGPGTPLIGAVGAPFLGNPTFAFTLSNAPALTLAELYVSFAPLDFPLGGGCSLYFDPLAFVAVLAVTTPSGDLAFPAPLPYEPLLVGSEAFAQWVVADPAGSLLGIATLTAGLRVRLGIADA